MPDRSRVLVVEDDAGLRDLLGEELESEGHVVELVESAEDARELLETRPFDLVVSDLRLPGEKGRELLAWVRTGVDPAPAFIMITAFGSVRQAVEALKAGAEDFLTKPLDLEHLRVSARRALENRELRREVRRFREAMAGDDFHGMVGQSGVMTRLYRDIQRVARSSGAVLVSGESGTGKELVARALHAESRRADGPFMAVNCAGIPADLLESEFFGHTEGAFTGATSDRRGLFLETEGGTILLDEIAEMPVALQPKLLRVLEDGRVRPVGSDQELPVDVRVVAATNRDLDQAMEEGSFRKDLYYRLETYHLRVPPLRERGEDITRLALRFLRRVAAGRNGNVESISSGALDRLRHYAFPGNVRELENAIERAATYCDGAEIRPEHLPDRILRGAAAAMGPGEGAGPLEGDTDPRLLSDGELPPLDELERRYIVHVLDRLGGNKRRAADVLGIGRRTLYRRLDAYESEARASESRDSGSRGAD